MRERRPVDYAGPVPARSISYIDALPEGLLKKPRPEPVQVDSGRQPRGDELRGGTGMPKQLDR